MSNEPTNNDLSAKQCWLYVPEEAHEHYYINLGYFPKYCSSLNFVDQALVELVSK